MVKPASKAGKSSIKGKTKGGQGGKGRFKKNDPETGFVDERINRSGQNRKFTEFHRILDRLFNEKLEVKSGGVKTGEMSVLETMTRDWIASRDFNKQNKALEYYVGKVADELTVHSDIDDFIKNNISIFTDGQLSRLAAGENPMSVLGEVLQEVKGFIAKKNAK